MDILEKRPWIMIVLGVLGVSLSSIFVKYSEAPSAVTAAWRLAWTVALMTPAVFGSASVRRELFGMGRRLLLLSILSGLFLAAHFATWFESLLHTSVASSTTIVSTEVIWVSLGWWLVLKGKLSGKAMAAIAVTFLGSVLIALADRGSAGHLKGDLLALVAAIAVAVYVLIGRVARQTLSTSVYTYTVYSACALALTVLCAVQGQSLFAHGWSPVIVGLLLSVFSTILGHSIFSWCLKFFSPAYVSASKLCEPVVAAVLAVFLFGEVPGPLLIGGSLLILGGVLYYTYLEASK